MMQRRVALLGNRQGPWVPVSKSDYQIESEPAGVAFEVETCPFFVRLSVQGPGPYEHITAYLVEGC